MKKYALFLLTFFMAYSNTLTAQNSIVGEWKGAIHIQGQQLSVIFHIENEGDSFTGSIDIPQQGAMGLPLTRVEQDQDSILFAFFTGQGDGVFEGIFDSSEIIQGTYSQGTASFPFKVNRSELQGEDAEDPGAGREIIISNNGVDIGGTLVIPESDTEPPLMIMISGSGAQDRDSNVFNFRIFAEMADQLKEQGIASFRYDDRGIGKSGGRFSEATLEILSGDVKAIIDHFTQNSAENFSSIILLGHSQGGIVAGKTAAEMESVDGLVLMASTGINLKELLRFQVKQAFGTGVHPKERVEQEIDLREDLMLAIRSGEDIEEAKKDYATYYRDEILANLSQAQKNSIGNLDTVANNQADQLELAFSSPQIQSLLYYDPTIDLASLDITVLVLFGGKDTQVTETLNRSPIEKALDEAGVKYRVKTFPDANHLFQEANSGQVSEYAILEQDFTDGFIYEISDWVKEK